MHLSTVLLFLFLITPAVRLAAELDHQAYVWQRLWTPAVVRAVEGAAEDVSELSLLAAELIPEHPRRDVEVAVDWAAVRASGLPVRLSIRVNGSRKPEETWFVARVGPWVQELLRKADAEKLQFKGIEIDYDCPSSRLSSYTRALKDLRPLLGDVPLRITTLPTWMNEPRAFRGLVDSVDDFVLQVHSIQRPQSVEGIAGIFEDDAAAAWITEASRFGVGFRVALPTYSVRAGFTAEGTLSEVAGEASELERRSGWTYRMLRSDPLEVAKTVRRLDKTPVPNLQGILWYRLPVGDERMNWDPLTWRTVMSGKPLEAEWAFRAVLMEEGLIEIRATPPAMLATPPPRSISIRWDSGEEPLAWDGQRSYRMRAHGDGRLLLEWPGTLERFAVNAQEAWTVGWIRFSLQVPSQLIIETTP